MNAGTYTHTPSPPHRSSPPRIQGGYPSTGAYHPMNYSPPSSMPPYGYPPPQTYSSSPPMYPAYTAASYPQQLYSPPSPQTDRQGWWYTPHPSMSSQRQYDSGSEYQNSFSGLYTISQQMDRYSPSSQSRLTSPISSPTTGRVTSHEQRPIPSIGVSSEVTGRDRKPVTRRSYHPNPPAHRSEWVMWAGNVPSDATHDELWRFFTSFPEAASPNESGVLSIFLISRSSCGFVNYDSEPHLHGAIERFNGQSLRPDDAQCPKLLCRIRKRDDDLKAGVGGQRGIGMHLQWVKEQKARAVEAGEDVSPTDVSASDELPTEVLPDISSISISSDNDPRHRRPRQSTGSSASYTSTNSSFLSRYFPQRYFILKSLTQARNILSAAVSSYPDHCLQFDLDLSTEKGLWATQKHNEGILDQAYRSSQDVFLIFSVNKSGEFYGYARMAGPIRRGEHKVSWATRASDSASPRSSLSLSSGRADEKSPNPGNTNLSKGGQSNLFFSPDAGRLVDQSPLPISGYAERQEDGPPTSFPQSFENTHSAPAELGAARPKTTPRVLAEMHSFDHLAVLSMPNNISPPDEDFELDPEAPVRAMRSGPGDSSISTLESVAEEAVESGEGKDDAAAERDWGESFKIEWITMEKISFQRTRHIRNPWNHDREVKVSRDGTELESGVGRKLLEEWSCLAKQRPTQPAAKANSSKRGSNSTLNLPTTGSEM
ncbi:hypothetical protein DXG01_008029 [Tephrocybe rancida]|nr:hypothetical protein DXG01_008029 [Tephrocybe rancida]